MPFLKSARLLCRFFLFALLLATAFAEPAPEIFEGRVLDPTRARIPGARITVVTAANSSPTSAVSGASGEFTISLPPGNYSITIEKDGFLSATENISLQPGGSHIHDVVLQIASASESLTVVETGPYVTQTTSSATKTPTPLLDVPQAVSIVTREQIKDQLMASVGDVVRYVPGITAHQGENNRDQVIIRGNSSSADFFVNGVRDDVQYYRDLYNLERVEALKGPNALIFGRGGAGGVINRVTKEAGFAPLHEFTIQGGSFNDRRFSADLDQPFGDKIALRLNGMYEGSDSFRDFVDLERYGISPTLTLAPSDHTHITLNYENFHDGRTADRGITSFNGKPADVPITTYYGDPEDSHVRALVNLGAISLDHQAGGLNIRNRSSFASYDRGYQNFVPGAVTPDKSQVAITAYDNATDRLNLFNQTDLTYVLYTGRIRHTLLGGAELGRQLTDNFRNTGFFNNTSTSILAPYTDPTINTPVTFRQSATDANNHLRTNLAATYVQDQVEISRYLQLVGGVRFDYFDLEYLNNRNADKLRRIDNLVSPRAGVVVKPIDRLSIYGSYSISYLPSSGDQFSSLTTITQQVKPEKFTNYELGIKYDLARALSLTAALYRLDRTNTRSTDPNDPTRIIQTGSTRSNGFEFGINGNLTRAWSVAGGYAYQDAYIRSATATALAGLRVAQVPHNSFSLWNNYRVTPRVGVGLGILNRSDMFAAIDNTVTLPSYTRADVAFFVPLTEKLRLQANVENVFNTRYYINSDSNTNISPGSSRAVRLALNAHF
jgi:catecholate siderophore receptor